MTSDQSPLSQHGTVFSLKDHTTSVKRAARIKKVKIFSYHFSKTLVVAVIGIGLLAGGTFHAFAGMPKYSSHTKNNGNNQVQYLRDHVSQMQQRIWDRHRAVRDNTRSQVQFATRSNSTAIVNNTRGGTAHHGSTSKDNGGRRSLTVINPPKKKPVVKRTKTIVRKNTTRTTTNNNSVAYVSQPTYQPDYHPCNYECYHSYPSKDYTSEYTSCYDYTCGAHQVYYTTNNSSTNTVRTTHIRKVIKVIQR